MPSPRDCRCMFCGFDTHEDLIQGAFWTVQGYIVVEDIPARSCRGCGELFFTEETTLRIQQLLSRLPAEPKRLIRASAYSMTAFTSSGENSVCQMPNLQPDIALAADPQQDPQPSESPFESQRNLDSLLCPYCKFRTVACRVRSVFWAGETLIIIENIPSQVCPTCQEKYYSESTLERIDALLKNFASDSVTLITDIPSYSLTSCEEKS